MVGKRRHSASPSTSKRSPVLNVEPALANRPKRNISPKNLDLNSGLSWREERELKKALYASLQEVKKPFLKSEEDLSSFNENAFNSSCADIKHPPPEIIDKDKLSSDRYPETDILNKDNSLAEKCSNTEIVNKDMSSSESSSSDAVSSRTRRHSTRLSRSSSRRSSIEACPVKLIPRSTSLDDSSQDSIVSSSVSISTQDSIKKGDDSAKKKYRAQRKFAQMQGYSPSSTPVHTPVKLISKAASPMKLFPKRAKTEDFLTFLCLRKTNFLPPHLDFFNYSREEGDSSYPATPSNGRSVIRETSPSSSSTGCSNEGFDPPVLLPIPKLMTPNRKAARACAGTPEIARGLASVSPRLKKSSPSKSSPLSSKYRGKFTASPQITPSKSSKRSPGKLSPLTKSGIRSFTKHTASDRITMKRKAVATLTSAKLSPKKVLKKISHLFDDDDETCSTITPNDAEKKTIKRKYERKIESRKKQDVKKKRKQKKLNKDKEGFIASRLPKRNASKRAFKLYMELDEFDESLDRQRKVRRSKFFRSRQRFGRSRDVLPEETGVVHSIDDSYEEFENVTRERPFRQKRKPPDMKDFDSEDSEISFPLKEKRLKEEKDVKNKTNIVHRKKLKQLKKTYTLKKGTSKSKASSNAGNSPRMRTRSTSSSTPLVTHMSQSSCKKISSAKLCANKKLLRIKGLRKSLKSTDKGQIGGLIRKKKKDKTENINVTSDGKKKSTAALSLKMKNKITVKSIRDRNKLPSIKSEPFPAPGEPPQMVEIPIYYPSEEEFQDAIKYIQSISKSAENYGMCKIVPPSSWKLDSKVNEEMRFTTQKQYIHKLYHRYGPNVQQMESIKKHLETHGVSEPMPVIGGVEVDLCKLSATIQEFGGMQNVMEKKKWLKIADAMKIPKSAQDRGTKLDDAYCKFLLSYDTMSPDEKQSIEEQVKLERHKIKHHQVEDSCIVKGKNMQLMTFSRTARNTMSMWFKDEQPTPEQVEIEFWKIVRNRSDHVVVHAGHVDTQAHHCSLFPSKRDHQYSRHHWNLNNLPYSLSSILKYLRPLSSITVPTLHIGMLHTASCWSTDIHYLPYVQYLHSESEIIWYSIPKQEESKFKSALKELVPTLMKNEGRWLKEDTVIVPPQDLIQKGVSMGRCIQRPREFVVVFPKCYTATVSCGYTLAESVHYATTDWIPQGMTTAHELHKCREPELISMDELLCNMAEDSTLSKDDLELVFPAFQRMIEEELNLRKQLHDAGLKTSKKMFTNLESSSRSSPTQTRKGPSNTEENISVCDASKKMCYLSLVLNEAEDLAYSLEEGLSHIHKKRNIKTCKLIYRHTEDELKKMLTDVRERLNSSHVVDKSSGSHVGDRSSCSHIGDKLGRRYSKARSDDLGKS